MLQFFAQQYRMTTMAGSNAAVRTGSSTGVPWFVQIDHL
jgi:uncharacterized protein YraI